MATQQESETAETLAGGFTELTNSKTPGLGPKPDDNGNLGSNHCFQNEDTVLVAEQDAVGNISGEGNHTVSVEGNEFHGDGISLLVEVHGTLENDKETEKEQLAKGGRESGMELRGNNSAILKTSKRGDATEEKAQNETINEDGRAKNEADNEDEEREDSVDKGVSEHLYSVGDFIWGKIKSHPWWPGRIYDPSDASEFAMKYKPTGRFLVVYFGDGSFSWCLPSQLKPFAENFEEMSKQSSLKTFLNAVDKALDEIGTLLELEMTCQCIPQEHIAELSRPLAVNAGIKAGVLVPKGDTCRFTLPSCEPQLVLLNLRDLAQTISLPSRLEFVVLTSWLSAFYRAQAGHRLSLYYEPSLIEGLEDKTRNHAVDGNDFSVPIEVPIQGPLEEEWVSYRYAGPKNCPVFADDNLYHHRKQKSVAELMGENLRSDVGNNSDSVAQVTETGMKEGRKEADCYNATKTLKKRNPLSIECKENGALNNVGEAKEESVKSPVSRERKKSKYLSPPFTSPSWITGRSGAKREFELESEKISRTARVGDRMMKAAAEIITPHPMSGHNSEAVKEKVLEQSDDLDKEPHIGKENHEMILGTMYMNASINQVLSEVQSTAINPLRKTETLDMIREFISAFRKSVYLNGSNYKVHHSRQPGRKRTSSCSLPETHVGVLSATNAKSQLRRKRTKLSETETAKVKKSASTSFGLTEDKEVARKTFPISLMVTFSPGYPLPSKKELVRIFSRYGDLNEKETNTYYNSNCVQVVYESGSDAEAAFREAIKKSPFGAAHVNYRLRYSSDASRALGGSGQKISSHKQNPKPILDSQLEYKGISHFGSIKQNLNTLKSMLRKCNGKFSQEEKFDLEGEIKGLLEKVSTMDAAP